VQFTSIGKMTVVNVQLGLLYGLIALYVFNVFFIINVRLSYEFA